MTWASRMMFLLILAFTGGAFWPVPLPAATRVQAVAQALDEAQKTMVSDPSRSLAAASRLEELARKLPPGRERSITTASALWIEAEARLRLGEPQNVPKLIQRALGAIEPLSEPMKLRGDILLTRGGWEVEAAQPAAALATFQDAYRVFTSVRSPRGQALALQNIAVLYTAAGDFERAIRYYRNADEAFRGDPKLALFSAINQGALFLQAERFAEARDAFLAARLLVRHVGSAGLEITIATNLARAYIGTEDFDRAMAAISRGREIARRPEARGGAAKLNTVDAQLRFEQKEYASAAALLDDVFEGMDLTSTPNGMRDAHFTAFQVYSKVGRPALALQHLEAERRLANEANKVALSTSAALMAARFDYANQELRIANLKAEELRRNIAFERDKAQTERLIFAGVAGATIIIIALLSFGIVTIRRSRNQVRDANVVLGETNVALEKALQAKTEFLATTSHEIRTPLNGILGMTQVMLADGAIDRVLRDRIEVVHGAGLTMRSLVDDILDMAKMETGNLTIDPQPMDFMEAMRDVCRIWEEQARAKGLAFRLDVEGAPHWIESDAGRLRQIVFNLLSNAIKFTAAGQVSLTATHDAQTVRIEVRDSGIGIPKEAQAAIFESFKQVDTSTTRQFGGTGLGLAICRNLARALGGDVQVASTAGKGAIFAVTIPYVRVEPPNVQTEEADACGLAILDRNPIARAMLKTMLEPRCGSVTFADDAQELIEMTEAGRVDRLLIDGAAIEGEGDAVAILARIVAVARPRNVATAVLWPAPDAAMRSALEATGVGAVISKPVAGQALVEQVLALRDVRLVSQAA